MSGISWWDEHQTVQEEPAEDVTAPVPSETSKPDEYQPYMMETAMSADDTLPEPLPSHPDMSYMDVSDPFGSSRPPQAPIYGSMPYVTKSYDGDTVDDISTTNVQKLLLAPNEEIRLHAYDEPLSLCCVYGDINVLCNNVMPKRTYFLPANSVYWVHSINGACISLGLFKAETPPEVQIHTISQPGGKSSEMSLRTPSLDAAQQPENILAAIPPKKSGFRIAKSLKKMKSDRLTKCEKSQEDSGAVATEAIDTPATETGVEAPQDPVLEAATTETLEKTPTPIEEVKFTASPGTIQIFKGATGPISFYQEQLKSLIITPRLSNQTPFRVLAIAESFPGDLYQAISAMLVNLTRIFGMSSIVVDLDASAAGLVNIFPETVSAVMLDESLSIADSFEKCVPIIFPSGKDAEGEMFTRACVGLSKTMVETFILQRAQSEMPPFGGTVVMCSSKNMEVIKGVASLFEITDVLVFDAEYKGEVTKESLTSALLPNDQETSESDVKIHELPYIASWDCAVSKGASKWREYFFGRVTPLVPCGVAVPIDMLDILAVGDSGELLEIKTFDTLSGRFTLKSDSTETSESIAFGQILAVSAARSKEEVASAPFVGFCAFQGLNRESVQEGVSEEAEEQQSAQDNMDTASTRIVLLSPGEYPFPSRFLVRMDARMGVRDLLP